MKQTKFLCDILVRNTDILVRNTDIQVRNTDILVRNTDILVRNTDILIRNTDILVRITDILVRNTDILVRKLSSPDAEVKLQHTWLSFKPWIQQLELPILLIRRLNRNYMFELKLD